MMAPPLTKTKHFNSQKESKLSLLIFIKKYANINYIKTLAFDPAKLPIVSVGILLAELVLNIFVIEKIRYTEIDWVAYMQECEGFLNGTTNYALLKGDTGPLVYPAGFVYIYSILYFITSRGINVKLAQYIFMGIYLLQMFFVLRLYSKSRKLPPYVLVITTFTSYRIHSIYVLRLFNDPIAILFLYAALDCFFSRKWTLGSTLFSLGVSVKMNILLFAPAILLFYITNLGYLRTVYQLCICGVVQLVLGAPFLATYPIQYIRGSFDLGRVFEHKWTVNYRFLDKFYFESRFFHMALLASHLVLLLIFAIPAYKYLQSYCRLRVLETQLQPQIDVKNLTMKREKIANKKLKEGKKQEEEEPLTPDQQTFLDMFEKSIKKIAKQSNRPKPKPSTSDDGDENTKYAIHFDKSIQLAVLPIFLCNFIGIVCSRSLHYQFYVWYFHSLPYLTWFTDLSTSFKFLILTLIEFAWNTYPSTNFSSALLHFCHIVLLVAVARKFFRS